MKIEKSLEILDQCIKVIDNMTEDEFNQVLREKGINDKNYDDFQYADEILMGMRLMQKSSMG